MAPTANTTTAEEAVARWNALVTANFPQLTESVRHAVESLRTLDRSIEEQRVLTRALALSHEDADALLGRLPGLLATYHVELETLVAQVNRTLDTGSALEAHLVELSDGEQAPVRKMDWAETVGASQEEAHLRARVKELEAEVERLRATSATAPPADPDQERVLRMQDELVNLRQTMQQLSEPVEDAPGLTLEDPAAAIREHAFDPDGKRRPMGLILVKAGVITPEQLETALSQQRNAWNRHLGGILVDLGFVNDEAVAQAIAAQTRTPFVRLSDEHIDRQATSLIARKMAVHHMAIPLTFEMNDLRVAMANPLDLVALEDLKLATGRPVSPVVATTRDIEKTIDRIYGQSAG